MESKTTALGIMSGSSLDGLDLCFACFHKHADGWAYDIVECKTIEIPEILLTQLAKAPTMDTLKLLELDIAYGRWIGGVIKNFNNPLHLIAIHGHTVFHAPEKGLSLQIGNGEIIHHLTKIPTIANFRNTDIHLGGQGAPLVPMGEKLLFPTFDGFLNLGGICNGSFNFESNWIAGDIGPCNQVFNYFSAKLGHIFDSGGQLAASGQVIEGLMNEWKSIDFFKRPFPKSLGNSWVNEHFLKLNDFSSADVLRTFSFFIANEIAKVLNQHQPKRVLISGGGAFNSFLIDQIKNLTNTEIVIPETNLVNFKEALIFAFLGLLRLRGETNILSSCTGAVRDSCSGIIYSSVQNV